MSARNNKGISIILERPYEFPADVDTQTRITIPKTLRNLYDIQSGDVVIVKLIGIIHTNLESGEDRESDG